MSCALISNSKDSPKPPLKIMIVEDQMCLSHLYYIILDKHLLPITTTIFYDPDAGKDAIKYLQSGNIPDFAILDIRLNGVNGIDVYRELRKVSNIPVIFLTAMSDFEQEFKEACQAVGKENVIKKDNIRFFEDLLPKIPNVKEYLRCSIECLRGKNINECELYKTINGR